LEAPSPTSFQLATEEPSSSNNRYRHFKNDLLLSKTELKDASGKSWEMKTRRGPDNMGEWINENKDPFNPLAATSIFLEKVCTHAVERATQIFGDDKEIHVYFTAPNYSFEGDDVEEGQKKSEVYRRNFRSAVERFENERVLKNATFMTKGFDFLYEPYAVYYYYSLLEHEVELSEDQAGKTYLVFDMGGSTTDVSLVQVNRKESDFRLYPVCRSIRRAGAYFDRYILGNLIGQGQAVRRDAKKWNEALERIEQAKIDLCEGRKEEVEVDIEGETYTLTRERIGDFFRTLWKNDNLRLGQAFRGFIGNVRAMVKDHGQLLEFDEIEKVFLAGGSTGLPGIEDLIREDLESLGLLNDDMTSCVRPHRTTPSGKNVMPSSLAALGQSVSIAEGNPNRLLEEFEHVFVRLEDDNGHPYSFQRKKTSLPEGLDEGDVFLLDKNELNRKNKLRLEPTDDGDGVFERIPLERDEKFPKTIDLYVRAGANPYPEEPQRTFVGRTEAVDIPPERADGLRFASIVESGGFGGIKVRPSMWYRQLETESPSRYHDDVSPIHISMRRETAPSDVHICVDFGMNNTVVALHAPGRDFPSDADDLVVFPFIEEAGATDIEEADVVDRKILLRHLPLEPLSAEAAVEGIAALKNDLRDAAQTDAYLRCARGAHVTRHIEALIEDGFQANKEANTEAHARLSNALQERIDLTVDISVLREEADTFRRMLRRHDSDTEAIADWLRDAHEENSNLTFDDVQEAHNQVEPLPWPPNDSNTDSENPESDEVEPMQEEARQNDNNSEKLSAEPSEGAKAGEHWAEGLAQWIDERVEKSTAPLRQSSSDMRETTQQLGNIADKLKDANAPNGNAATGAELLKGTLEPLQKQLGEIASALKDQGEASSSDEDEVPTDSAVYLDNVIAKQVEEGPPLSQANSEDVSYLAFKKFIEKKDLVYSEHVLRQVWTRCTSGSGPLIILAGPPGSGKTSLVRLLAEFFNRSAEDGNGKQAWKKFYHLQPVSPSWFSPEDLLGSFSILHNRFSETPFLRFLMKAECHFYNQGDDSRLFFACLDEFNIAQPEQYLADVLSKMESPVENGSPDRIIPLCSAEQLGREKGDLTVELTPNVRLFATVNTDISTKTLSPKVLDRSFFLRLTPALDELNEAADIMNDRYEVPADFHEAFQSNVLPAIEELSRAGQTPVGFRLIEQTYAYASEHPLFDDNPDENAIADVTSEVLTGFFLPKLPGVFSIDDPNATYEKLLKQNETLHSYENVKQVLDNILSGLPGQAAL